MWTFTASEPDIYRAGPCPRCVLKGYSQILYQGRSLRGGKGGNCPPWDFQFLWFFKLIIPKSNTEIATWYLLRRHCPPAYLGQATALYMLWLRWNRSVAWSPVSSCVKYCTVLHTCTSQISQHWLHFYQKFLLQERSRHMQSNLRLLVWVPMTMKYPTTKGNHLDHEKTI